MTTRLPRRLTALALILILWLAWGLALYRLDAQSLWYDEGVTATIAQRPLAALTQWTARDIQPPLYYYVVAGWGRAAGWSEWSLRFVSAWWGLLTVGLMAALTLWLTGRRAAALIAALLTAAHPLLLYYSQEARMYTMLVALGVMAVYLLLRARQSLYWRLWVAYLLAAVAAVYTHYFAFFLLLALGLAYLLDLLLTQWRTRKAANQQQRWRRRTLLPFLLANVAVVLLYGLWIVTLFNQLGSDASYWQGPFKVGDALRTLAISFVVGESVLETQAVPWLAAGTMVLLLALAAIVCRGPKAQPEGAPLLVYTLPWLIGPVAGVLGLATFVPKFNARYVMLALPGLIVIWSSGLATLWEGWSSVSHSAGGLEPRPRGPRAARWGRRVVGLSGLVALLVTFAYADYQWFTDPAFTKAQWRALSDYVRTHRQPDEAVVLVSGHAWPIWDYYAPDIPTVRLPDLEILDVDAVLDFAQSAPLLQHGLQGKRGVWLVTWQDEVVDPTGVTALHLGLAGQERAVDAQFWQLGLRHFVQLDPAAITPTPPIDQPLDANFANQLLLRGYAQTTNDDLLLFWQLAAAAKPPLPDLQLNLRTTTADGLPYADPADRRPADYTYPVSRWRPGQLVVGRIPVAEWAGAAAMPGVYQLHLGVYDPAGDPAGLDLRNETGVALGKSVTLDLTLAQPTAPPDPPAVRGDVTTIVPGVVVAYQPRPVRAEPGEPVLLTLYWQMTAPSAPPALALQWQPVDQQLPTAIEPFGLPAAVAFHPGVWLRQVLRLQPPLTLLPGAYRLVLGPPAAGGDGLVILVTILPSTRYFTLPPLAVTTATDLFTPGDRADAQVTLAGMATALPPTLAPTASLTVTLVWQTPDDATAPQADYNVSVQLLGQAGLPVTQRDAVLPLGASTWLPGQVVTQTLTLPAPPHNQLPAGQYRLIAAIYPPDVTGGRLTTAVGVDYVELAAAIAVPARASTR